LFLGFLFSWGFRRLPIHQHLFPTRLQCPRKMQAGHLRLSGAAFELLKGFSTFLQRAFGRTGFKINFTTQLN
jgi:hypothetical protein